MVSKLSNLHTVRAAFKGFGSQDVRSVIDKLERVFQEKVVDEEREALRLEKAAESVSLILDQMQELGVTVDMLMPGSVAFQKVKRSSGKLYRFNGEHGVVEWRGFGRIPLAMKAALDSGVSLESLLVK